MTTQRTPAHPADSAEALRERLYRHFGEGLSDREYDAIVRIALQASDSRVPTDSQREDLVAACYELNIYSRGDLGMRLEAERPAPSPAAERIDPLDDPNHEDFDPNPKLEGSEPLDVERLRRAYCIAKHGGEHQRCDSWTVDAIYNAYASPTSEGTE